MKHEPEREPRGRPSIVVSADTHAAPADFDELLPFVDDGDLMLGTGRVAGGFGGVPSRSKR